MKHEDRYRCPQCSSDKFHINAKSMKKGDKPTEAECEFCGFGFMV